MNQEKCCEKCYGGISGLQWWCNDNSCPCHKPSVAEYKEENNLHPDLADEEVKELMKPSVVGSTLSPQSTEMEECNCSYCQCDDEEIKAGAKCEKLFNWENEIDIEFNIDMLKANVKEIIRKALSSYSQKLVSELREKCLKQISCTQDIDGGVCDCCEMNYNRIDEIKLIIN